MYFFCSSSLVFCIAWNKQIPIKKNFDVCFVPANSEVIWVSDVSASELISQRASNSQQHLSGALQTERCLSDADNVPPLKPGTPLQPLPSNSALTQKPAPHFNPQHPVNIKLSSVVMALTIMCQIGPYYVNKCTENAHRKQGGALQKMGK